MQKEKDTSYGFLVVMIIFIVIIFLGYWIAILKYIPSSWPIRGQFGDMFGWVNALFSGLAFAGLIYTIFLQRKELSLQRQELKLTRDELKGQKEQLEAQNETWQEQNFNNMFFQLLDYFDRQASGVYLSFDMKGKPALRALQKSFVEGYKSRASVKEKFDNFDDVIECFRGYLHDERLLSYFQVFSSLIEFLEMSEVRYKLFYVRVIESLLSDPEEVLIFYYGLFPEGKHIKAFAEQYGFFCNLNNAMIGNIAHRGFYVNSAFAKLSE